VMLRMMFTQQAYVLCVNISLTISVIYSFVKLYITHITCSLQAVHHFFKGSKTQRKRTHLSKICFNAFHRPIRVLGRMRSVIFHLSDACQIESELVLANRIQFHSHIHDLANEMKTVSQNDEGPCKIWDLL